MSKDSIFGLTNELVSQIIKIILDRKEPEKIVIFGSRAQGVFKYNSDIDIAIFGRDWTDSDIAVVKLNLDEDVPTPLKFDVLNFYTITKERLKKNILNKGRVIYDSGKD
ncbi:MAG: nucleotidyltransferase domain-containing protein [Candidatus Omnitrophota bacterium]|nr:nucleotidyltransferase domain-containing protein [Candidatus Omnitrophota bacterium]